MPCFLPTSCISLATDVRQSTTLPKTSKISTSTSFKRFPADFSGCGCDDGCAFACDMISLEFVYPKLDSRCELGFELDFSGSGVVLVEAVMVPPQLAVPRRRRE